MLVDYPQFGTLEARTYLSNRVQLIARSLRDLAEQSSRKPFDPFAFAKKIGIEVSIVNLPKGCSGRLRTDTGYTLIEIESQEPLVRQRFTLCHELAHICFWSGGPIVKERGQVFSRTNNIEFEERLCDQIASELLMPTKTFVSAASRRIPCYQSVYELSQRFQVSMLAAIHKVAKTRGHGWTVAMLKWRYGPDGRLVRASDITYGGLQLQERKRRVARSEAQDAFARAERLIHSSPEGLSFFRRSYIPLGMPSPDVTIWRRQAPTELYENYVQGATFFPIKKVIR